MSVRTPYITLILPNYGEVSDDWRRRLTSVELEENTEQAAVVRLSFEDALSLRDSDVLKLHRQFYVVLGWSDSFQWRGPFIVREVIPAYESSGLITLRITGQDRSLAMNRKRASKNHTGSISDIVKGLAKSYGLGFDIDDIDGEGFDDDRPAHQSSETDAEFLRRLANTYGFQWYVRDGVLHFKAPTADQDTPSMIFSWGINDKSITEYRPIYRSWQPSPAGPKMAGASQHASNVDIEKGESFSLVQTLEDSAKEMLGLSDDVKEEGESSAAEVAYSGEEYLLDPEVGDLYLQGIPALSESDDSSAAVIPRTATPPTEKDAAKSLPGLTAKGSDLAGGNITLREGNISVRPRFTIQVLCPSAVDSGRFRVKSVRHSISKQGFTTAIVVGKIGVGKGSSTAAAAASAEAEANGTVSTTQASDTQSVEQLTQLDPETGLLSSVTEKVTTTLFPSTGS